MALHQARRARNLSLEELALSSAPVFHVGDDVWAFHEGTYSNSLTMIGPLPRTTDAGPSCDIPAPMALRGLIGLCWDASPLTCPSPLYR